MKELYCLGKITERFNALSVNYQPMQFSFNRKELEEMVVILNNQFPDDEYQVFEVSKGGPAWTKEDAKRFEKEKEGNE